MAGGSFKTPRARLVDLEAAYADRLADANQLLGGARHASAIAMALYALEIQLKVQICRRLDLDALPTAFEIHDLDSLLVLSGLSRRLGAPRSRRVRAHWDFVTGRYSGPHPNDFRYLPDVRWTAAEADDLLHRLQDPPDGVLPWLLSRP